MREAICIKKKTHPHPKQGWGRELSRLYHFLLACSGVRTPPKSRSGESASTRRWRRMVSLKIAEPQKCECWRSVFIFAYIESMLRWYYLCRYTTTNPLPVIKSELNNNKIHHSVLHIDRNKTTIPMLPSATVTFPPSGKYTAILSTMSPIFSIIFSIICGS